MSHRGELYQIGDLLEVTVEFVDIDGVPANPSLINFFIRDPSGNVAELNEGHAINTAVGEWRWLMPTAFDQAGTWRFRAAATQGVVTAVERTVGVAKSLFG